jgi:hypothetical protein
MITNMIDEIRKKPYYIEENDVRKIMGLITKQLSVFDDFTEGDKIIISKDENDISFAHKESNMFYLAPVTRWFGSQGRMKTIEYMIQVKKNIEVFEELISHEKNYNYIKYPILIKLWDIKCKYNKGITLLKKTYGSDKETRDKLLYFML